MIHQGVQIASAPPLDDGDPHLAEPRLTPAARPRIVARYRLPQRDVLALLAGASVEVEVSASGVAIRVRR